MRRCQIPHTPFTVPPLILGCMQLGGSWDDNPLSTEWERKACAAVEAALEMGVEVFDHADIYCRGKSEMVFARLWKTISGLREKIVLQTKCGIRFAGDPDESSPGRYDFSYNHIIVSVEGSLRRLDTSHIDILLLHRPDPLVEPEEVARAFDELQQSGKVRYFGVSNHTPAQIRLLQKYLRQPLVANQIEWNLLHTGILDSGIDTISTGEGLFEFCRLHDIAIQAYSPLARGRVFAVDNLRQCIAELAAKKNTNETAIALAWLLRHPGNVQVVVGSTNPQRIRAAGQALEIELSREEWYRLYIAGRKASLP